LYAGATVSGALDLVPDGYVHFAKDVLKKRYGMREYRGMMQKA
jgi:hypothetical protein